MSTQPPPTNTELSILGVLWSLGPSTVRDVHEQLSKRESIGYTSVLKMLQVMHKKGLVRRDESQRSHVYRAAKPAAQIQHGLVRDLITRAFAGSAADLAVRALSARTVSKEELARVRAFLDDKERDDG